jgi:hypothetical protein
MIYFSVNFFMNVTFNYCYYSNVFEVLYFVTAFVAYRFNSSIYVILPGKSPTFS